MCRMPWDLYRSSCAFTSSREEAMQERCGAASCPAARISSTVSSVPSRVEPPAPKVTEKKSGSSAASCCHVSRSLDFPAGVFGGKNSKLKTLFPIQVGLERGEHRLVHRRCDARLARHACHRAAKPWRLQLAARFEIVRHGRLHLRRQRIQVLQARLDEVVGELDAARAGERPGL